jgi:hypothetical protein
LRFCFVCNLKRKAFYFALADKIINIIILFVTLSEVEVSSI